MCLLTILLFALVTVSRADDFREATTGILFPSNCATWTRIRVNEDSRKEVGVSVGYSDEYGTTITCRIFEGQFGPARNDPDAIRKEMEAISSGIVKIWTSMGYSVEMALPIGPIPSDSEQFAMLHRIMRADECNVSITLFRFHENRYISFRFTTLEQDTTEAFNDFGRFLVALSAAKRNEEPNNPVQETPAKAADPDL